jgi:PIN domain nuclease of toxin-antitoxin system
LPAIHRDPFDRLLIATAQQHRLTLLTPDASIAQYPNLQVAW